MLRDALQPFADLLDGDLGGGTLISPTIKVQMVKDAKNALKQARPTTAGGALESAAKLVVDRIRWAVANGSDEWWLDSAKVLESAMDKNITGWCLEDTPTAKAQPHFRVILIKPVRGEKWSVLSNPRWDACTRSQSDVLLNEFTDYAEYANSGVVYRMVRVKDLDKYLDDTTIKPEWTLDPSAR